VRLSGEIPFAAVFDRGGVTSGRGNVGAVSELDVWGAVPDSLWREEIWFTRATCGEYGETIELKGHEGRYRAEMSPTHHQYEASEG